jgi:Prokaryotic membrane lipoprotein lipid attachment site
MRRVLLFLALLLMLASCQNPSRPLPLDAIANTGRADHRGSPYVLGADLNCSESSGAAWGLIARNP